MRTRNMKHVLAGEIADAILHRKFAPGHWLRHVDVEEQFGASRSDVRYALQELALRKTIEHIPNRGYRVPQIDAATYRQIAETRILLEAGAASAIIVNMEAGAIEKLRLLAEEFGHAVRSGTVEEQSRINNSFHHLMYSHCGNPILEEMIWSLRDRSRGADGTRWKSHEALVRSDSDHHEMIDAILDRDTSHLARVITGHIAKGILKKS